VPGTAKYAVLQYVRMGILQLEHVTNTDLRVVAQLEARARRLQQELEARHPLHQPPAARQRVIAATHPR
jgi:hypothetical protein